MITSKMLEFGHCPCTESYESRYVAVRWDVEGTPVELVDVPVGFCQGCGVRVYKAEMLRIIEQLWGSRPSSPA
jgi:hypothetical protein